MKTLRLFFATVIFGSTRQRGMSLVTPEAAPLGPTCTLCGEEIIDMCGTFVP